MRSPEADTVFEALAEHHRAAEPAVAREARALGRRGARLQPRVHRREVLRLLKVLREELPVGGHVPHPPTRPSQRRQRALREPRGHPRRVVSRAQPQHAALGDRPRGVEPVRALREVCGHTWRAQEGARAVEGPRVVGAHEAQPRELSPVALEELRPAVGAHVAQRPHPQVGPEHKRPRPVALHPHPLPRALEVEGARGGAGGEEGALLQGEEGRAGVGAARQRAGVGHRGVEGAEPVAEGVVDHRPRSLRRSPMRSVTFVASKCSA